MRLRIVLVAMLAVAGAILPATSASAICSPAYQRLTGDCSPCHTLQRVKPDLICLQ